MKIRPVGTEQLHTDGRTDMTKLIVTFRSSMNLPKNDYVEIKGMLIDESFHKRGIFPGPKTTSVYSVEIKCTIVISLTPHTCSCPRPLPCSPVN